MATSAFGKAFAEARKAGDKEFSFNGKLYTTAMKGEKKAPGGREPVHIDAEAGMSRGRNDYVTSGKKSFDTETEFVPKGVDLERGMGRGSRVAYESQKAEQDAGVTPAKVRNLAKAFDVPVDRKDEAGTPYKKGGSVKGWGMARGARKAKMY
jgi:hypothetical protein